MRLSISQQRQLDILVKELRLKVEAMKNDAYMMSPDTRSILITLGDTLLLVEQKLNWYMIFLFLLIIIIVCTYPVIKDIRNYG